jgi:lysozyme
VGKLIEAILKLLAAIFGAKTTEEAPVVKEDSEQKIKNIEMIKKHEGLRLDAYLPTPNDVWTIGYGHTKTAKQGMKISEAKAEELLRADIAWVEASIAKNVKVPLTQNQYDALASLIYNIGGTAFAKSTLLKMLNAGDYHGAANQFLRWDKQKGKTLRGLTRRREEERMLFLKGK